MKPKQMIIVLVVLFVVVIGGFILKYSNDAYGSILFSYDIEQVEKIELQNGNTGDLVSVTDKDEIAEIIGALNSFRYSTCAKEETMMGWSFSIIVHENDVEDDAGRIYISSDSSIKINDYEDPLLTNHYFSSTSDYFNKFIEKWLP